MSRLEQRRLAVYRRRVTALLALSVYLLAAIAALDAHSPTRVIVVLGLVFVWLGLLIAAWTAWERLADVRHS